MLNHGQERTDPMDAPTDLSEVPAPEAFERLLTRHARAAAAAASEAASLARQLRAEGEQQLAEAAHRPPEEAHRLQVLGRAAILRAKQLLQLAACERLTAQAADGVSGARDLPR